MNHATPARFHDLCRRVGVAEDFAGKVFADLASLYAEDHRKYHNMSHIDRMLGWLDATGESMDSVELAIWFLSQRIYTTGFFGSLERQARVNIQDELG